jgi:hypothetical protein
MSRAAAWLTSTTWSCLIVMRMVAIAIRIPSICHAAEDQYCIMSHVAGASYVGISVKGITFSSLQACTPSLQGPPSSGPSSLPSQCPFLACETTSSWLCTYCRGDPVCALCGAAMCRRLREREGSSDVETSWTKYVVQWRRTAETGHSHTRRGTAWPIRAVWQNLT